MNRDPQRLRDYLGHILEAIERIQRYVSNMKKADYLASQIVQDAVIRNFKVIGEASRNIQRAYPVFAAEHPEIPLAVANDMRNALAHGYFKVDLDIVWETIHSELPPLQARVSDLQLGPLNHLRAFIWRGAPSRLSSAQRSYMRRCLALVAASCTAPKCFSPVPLACPMAAGRPQVRQASGQA